MSSKKNDHDHETEWGPTDDNEDGPNPLFAVATLLIIVTLSALTFLM